MFVCSQGPIVAGRTVDAVVKPFGNFEKIRIPRSHQPTHVDSCTTSIGKYGLEHFCNTATCCRRVNVPHCSVFETSSRQATKLNQPVCCFFSNEGPEFFYGFRIDLYLGKNRCFPVLSVNGGGPGSRKPRICVSRKQFQNPDIGINLDGGLLPRRILYAFNPGTHSTQWTLARLLDVIIILATANRRSR